MSQFIGGPCDGMTTEREAFELIMPCPGCDHVAIYQRDWKTGHFVFQRTAHEDHFLGRFAATRPKEHARGNR